MFQLVITQKNLKHAHTETFAYDVYRNLIHTCQNLETTKMSSSKQVEKKKKGIHTSNEILFITKKILFIIYKTWKNQMCIIKCKKSIMTTSWMFLITDILEKENCEDNKNNRNGLWVRLIKKVYF